MRIKHKFIIVGALILVSIASSLYIDHYKVTNISNFSQIALKISEVRADMLQLRRNEKDFLARTDIKYRDTFAQNYQKLVNETNQLAVAVTDAGLEFTQLQELEPLFQRYHDRFMALVALQQTMGFSYDDGLYGQLREAVHVVEQEIQAQDDQQLRADMLQLRRNEKDFLLRLQPKYSDQFNKNLIVFKQDIADSSLPYGVKQTINKHVDDYNNAFVTLTDTAQQLGLDHNSGLLGELRKAVQQSESLLGEISIALDEAINAKVGNLDRLHWVTSLIFLLLNGVIVVLIAWIGTTILKSLQTLNSIITIVADTNDLTLRAPAEQQDELAVTARAFNHMMEKFQKIIALVTSSSEHIACASEETSVAAIQASASISSQGEQTQNLAVAMNEMVTTIDSVAESTESAASVAQDANSQCETGLQKVQVATATMGSLAESVHRSEGVVTQLEDESKRIGAVIDVIRSIAEQTNLLALNAAIEAARAGEQGRGFAVVADEVRTLAGRTQDSTEEIQAMIESLQVRAQEAADLMTVSHQKTQAAVEQTSEVDDAIVNIVKAVEEITNLNTNIATAATEQSHTAAEVRHSVVKIDDAADESISGAQKIASASQDLTKLAKQLEELAAQFKIA